VGRVLGRQLGQHHLLEPGLQYYTRMVCEAKVFEMSAQRMKPHLTSTPRVTNDDSSLHIPLYKGLGKYSIKISAKI
jgi:hypothetical protein